MITAEQIRDRAHAIADMHYRDAIRKADNIYNAKAKPLPVMTKAEAKLYKYKAITFAINPKNDIDIIMSMQSTMNGDVTGIKADAVWIENSPTSWLLARPQHLVLTEE